MSHILNKKTLSWFIAYHEVLYNEIKAQKSSSSHDTKDNSKDSWGIINKSLIKKKRQDNTGMIVLDICR